jgi:hypothetical protein
VILTKAQILSMANEMQSGDPLNPATFETFGRGSTFQLLDAEIGRDGAVTMQRYGDLNGASGTLVIVNPRGSVAHLD